MNKNFVGGLIVAVVGFGCGLWLLVYLNKISGAEFVAFSLGFAVIGLIVTFSSEVQEFSIAGNAVKLRELRSAAEKTIEELKEARTELFRFMVQKSIEFSGGWGSGSKVDERVEQFIKLFEQIEKFECIKELQIDISKTLNILMIGQFNNLEIIHKNTKRIGDIFENGERPDILYIELEDKMINKILEQYSGKKPNFDDIKADVIQGIEAYSKLYAIKVKLDKLANES